MQTERCVSYCSSVIAAKLSDIFIVALVRTPRRLLRGAAPARHAFTDSGDRLADVELASRPSLNRPTSPRQKQPIGTPAKDHRLCHTLYPSPTDPKAPLRLFSTRHPCQRLRCAFAAIEQRQMYERKSPAICAISTCVSSCSRNTGIWRHRSKRPSVLALRRIDFFGIPPHRTKLPTCPVIIRTIIEKCVRV